MMIEITKDEARIMAEFIDTYLFQMIRDDPDIDNMTWLRIVFRVFDKMCTISGYQGMTDERKENEQA